MSANPPLSSNSGSVHAPSERWRAWQIVVAVVVLVLAAGAAGVFIGRATKAGKEAAPPSWKLLPEVPIVGRDHASAVWTGKEMIVWGGATAKAVRTPGPCDRCASDGAAYDPATRAWRTISPPPSGVQGGAAVAWTGDEMVVWASNSPDGPVGAAAYDPSTGTWRRLPAGPLGKRELYSSVWTGKELIVAGGALGDTLAKPTAAALDPRAGTWRLLPALNRLTGLMPGPAIASNGREAFLLGAVCPGSAESCSPTLIAYDPATDALRTIDLAKAPIVPEQQLTLVGWSGTDLVFSTVGVPTNVNSGKVVIIRYDPATGRWSRGTFCPYPVPDGTQTAWLGNRFVVADGSSGLQIYDLDADTWQTISPGPSPLSYRSGSAIVWTGTDLIAWSGTILRERTGAPIPNDGVSLRLKS